MRLVLFISLLFTSQISLSQGRKLPPFSFQEHSTEFADANRTYTSDGGYTQSDTLSDEVILKSLQKILDLNQELLIQLTGHTALNEDEELGMLRSIEVKNRLVSGGVIAERIEVKSNGHQDPILSDDVILSLPTKLEREVANQKNRRVVVSVVGKKQE